jgi:hypothetical protein
MAASADEREEELRRVYRKLKGVRCQLSMKLKELKKEAKETRYTIADDEFEIANENQASEAPNEELVCGLGEQEKGLRTGQSEVKTLLDHKKRLRKRFQKLKDEARGK